MNLEPYLDEWEETDPHANFKADVAAYTRQDPLPTLRNLSTATGVPLSSIVRYVLVKYAASGAEALLEFSPIVLRQMDAHIQQAEEAGSVEAKLAAYEALRQMVSWLKLGDQ